MSARTATPVHQSTATAQISAKVDLGERFTHAGTTRNVRKPIVAKHAFSRTAAAAAREDGVDTRTVTRRFIQPVEPVAPVPVFAWSPETDARVTKYVMYALEAEWEGDNDAALSWAWMARCVLIDALDAELAA